MKTVLYAALALSAIGMSGSAMAADGSNYDTYRSLAQSHQMQMDGLNNRAVNEGRQSVVDFQKNHPETYSILNGFRDNMGSNR